MSARAVHYPKTSRPIPPSAHKHPPDRNSTTRSPRIAQLLAEGRQIFRHDTFGSEAFWGDQLQLHQAILGEKKGGVGAGLTRAAGAAARVEGRFGAVPKLLAEVIKEGAVNLDDPDTTLDLLRADAVVGVKGVSTRKTTCRPWASPARCAIRRWTTRS